MIKIKVNKRQTVIVNEEKSQTYINGDLLDWNVAETSKDTFHVLFNNKSYRIEVVKKDVKEKKLLLKVNNKLIATEGKTELDQLLEEMGLSEQQVKRLTDLKAPMPGLILNLFIEEGQSVKKGESLLVLEAMKMENVIKASEDGIIKKVNVKPGDAVEKNQILLEFN